MSSDNDLRLLRAITLENAGNYEFWGEAMHAVDAILNILYVNALYVNAPPSPMWQDIYDAIKGAYVSEVEWPDE